MLYVESCVEGCLWVERERMCREAREKRCAAIVITYSMKLIVENVCCPDIHIEEHSCSYGTILSQPTVGMTVCIGGTSCDVCKASCLCEERFTFQSVGIVSCIDVIRKVFIYILCELILVVCHTNAALQLSVLHRQNVSYAHSTHPLVAERIALVKH